MSNDLVLTHPVIKTILIVEACVAERLTPRTLACSKRSDSAERCEVKKGMKSRGGLGRELLFFRAPFTSHRSPLSERLEQATRTLDLEVRVEALPVVFFPLKGNFTPLCLSSLRGINGYRRHIAEW